MASSADDLIGKVTEALQNSLLVAIGAVSSSPTQAVKTCQELGVSNEEEKLAKWVAVLKRDSQELFGKDFLSTIKEIYEKENKKMDTKFLQVFCKHTNQTFFPKVDTLINQDVVCPFCGTNARIDTWRPNSGMFENSKFHFSGHTSDMNSKSREYTLQLAMQSQGQVMFEGNEDGKFISVFEFLAEQPEFSKK